MGTGFPCSRDKKKRRLVHAFLAGLISLGAVALGLFALGPRLLEAIVASRIEGIFQRLSGEASFGRLVLRDFSTVDLFEISWIEKPYFSVRIETLKIGLDWSAVFFRRLPVQRFHVSGVSVTLGVPEQDGPSLAQVLERLRSVAQSFRFTGARGSGTVRSLPEGEIDDISVAIFANGGLVAQVSDARGRLGPPEGSFVGAGTTATLEGHMVLKDGIMREFSASAWTEGEGVKVVNVQVTPALEASISGGLVRVSGISVQGDYVTLKNPAWIKEGVISLEAESLALRTKTDRGASAKWPEGLAQLLAGRGLVEAELRRPNIVVSVAKRETVEGPTQQGQGFRDALLNTFAKVESKLEELTNAIERGGEAFVVNLVRVHGATVQYLGQGATLEGSLANLDMEVTREASIVTARITFECPEVEFGANSVFLRLDTGQAALRAEVHIRYLPLRPYAGLLPRWLLVSQDTALVDTDFTVQLDKNNLSFDGSLSLVHAGLMLPFVASEPMQDLALGVRGKIAYDRLGAALNLDNGLLSVGHIKVPFSLHMEHLKTWPRVRLDAKVSRIRAQDLVDSIPQDVIPALKGARLRGSFAASLEMDVNTKDLSSLRFDLKPDIADLSIIDPGQGVNLDLLRTEFYHRIDQGDKVIERVVGPSSPSWVPLEEVPRFFIDALTTSEDAQFFQHSGFSLSAIRRSLRVNLEKGGFYQGASTISQQLAKNLFLAPEKTLARKLQEAFITWQLERYLSKEKILELYINVVEWGPEVFGLREASIHYFGKQPNELNPLEAAYLVSILPNPKRYHAHFESGTVPPAFERRVRGLLQEMVRRGLLPQEEYERLMYVKIKFTSSKITPEEPIPEEEFSDDG